MFLNFFVFVTVVWGGSREIFAAFEQENEQDILAILKTNAQYMNERNPGSGQTPLMAASLSGKTTAVKHLLALGADPTIGEKDGYTPLHGVAFQGRADAARLLLADPRVPNEMHRDGFFPVHRACWGREKRHTDTLRVFLEAGEFDRKTKTGESLIEVCRKSANEGSSKLLNDWGSAAEEL